MMEQLQQDNTPPKRKRGAQPGNKNRLNHGKYSVAARAMRMSVSQPEKFDQLRALIVEAAEKLPEEKARKLLGFFGGSFRSHPRIRRV